MNDEAIVLAKRLDDLDLANWRERLSEAMRIVRHGQADEPVSTQTGSSCTWRMGNRSTTIASDAHQGLSIVSARQAFRRAYEVREAAIPGSRTIRTDDRTAIADAVRRISDAMSNAMADEGSDDDPSDTWDILSANLRTLCSDVVNVVADAFERTKEKEGLEMLKSYPVTLTTGSPWGSPRISADIDGDAIELCSPHMILLLESMSKSLTLVSERDPATLCIGPARVMIPAWRDPGPVARMRSLRRFTTRRAE